MSTKSRQRNPHPWALRNFGLSLVLLGLFLFSATGQLLSGHEAYNEERRQDGQPEIASVAEYAGSGHFISSVSENMESEFLQMALFVFLTISLFQKGSSESRKPPEEMTREEREAEAREQAYSKKKRAERPLLWRIYENSLTIALTLLFLTFFGLHSYGSWLLINEEHARQGEELISFLATFKEPEFWFESFQNWQSEFFSIAILGLLSIWLRQKDSPQSKKLLDPTWKTGDN